MVFSSVIFLFYFLPIVLFLYFAVLRIQWRNAVLLLASLFFYAWGEPKFVFVLILSISVNYAAGLLVERFRGNAAAKWMTAVSVLANLCLLFFYKYINFTIDILNRFALSSLGRGLIAPISVMLPIGLSFFTFQGLSYVIDVYRGKVPAQRNPFYIALYISMFPQLVAGPIVRYEDIYGDLREREISLERVFHGTRRFIAGLAKKVMIADILASTADKIFALSPDQLSTPVAWLGAVCYAFQIYFDFSGYSDMAIGLGKIFGFEFLENFNLPYISRSVTEFWRRWHISLSTWFRDYLYIPMGGNRRGNVYLHLLIVFLCTGLWHGAAFTFVFWGLWHGAFLLVERFLKRREISIAVPAAIRWIYAMTAVLLGWVLFRSDGLRYAFSFYKAMFGLCRPGFRFYGVMYYLDRQVAFTLLAAAFISLGGGRSLAALLQRRPFNCWRGFAESGALLVLLLFSMMMIVNGNYSPFIYFRF